MDCSPPGSSVHGISQARILNCLFFLPGIFLTQGWNLRLLHWQVISLPLSHPGSPKIRIHTQKYMCAYVYLCVYTYLCVCVCVSNYCYLESPIIRQNYCYYLNVREKIDKQNLICATEFFKNPNTATYKIDQGLIHLFCILRNWCSERLLLGQGQV